MYYDLDATERANKAGLLLAHDRYTSQYAPFIKSSKTRLAYVKPQIEDMLAQVASETNANLEFLKSRFADFINESVEQKMSPDGLPSVPNVEGTPDTLSDIKKTDVQDRGTVDGAGREEALDIPEEKLSTCVRCSRKFFSKVASPVCHVCTFELQKKAWGDTMDNTGIGTGLGDPAEQNIVPQDSSMPFVCQICGQQGSRDEIVAHVNQDHRDVLERQRQEQQNNPQAVPTQQFQGATKEAEDGDQDAARVEPLPESPADRFDDHVQDLANRAAARKFSLPDDQMIHNLASQLGVDENQIRQNLTAVAIFGNYVGVNGEIGGDPSPPDGYEEVALNNLGGRTDTHEALVPTDLVVAHVAEEMNMQQDLAYQQVRDRYGADLPDKYHASVSGEMHVYLPTELAGNQQPQQQQGYDPNVGPSRTQSPPVQQPVPA